MPRVTPQMGLRVWDDPNDPYDRDQLALNWAKVDDHDHTDGKGARIGTEALADGSVTAEKLAPGAVGVASVPDSTITSAKIVDGTIQNTDIATNIIESNRLYNSSDQTKRIQSTNIANGAVGTAQLVAGAVDTTALGANAVTSAKVLDGTLLGSDLSNGTITATQISDNTITGPKFTTTVADRLAVNSGSIRAGRAVTDAQVNVTQTAYTASTDQVANVVLPADGLIYIWYYAEWQHAASSSGGKAAVFVGSNQLVIANNTGNVSQEASAPATASVFQPLTSSQTGLSGSQETGNYSGASANGQIVGYTGSASAGGPIVIFANANTYTISVRFKVTTGSVDVRKRKLWVETRGFI